MPEFRLKPIEFQGRRLSILCQNENGPCPLLAIANVLILRGHIGFHPDIRIAPLHDVVQLLADHVFELNAVSGDADTAARQIEQFNAVIKLIPVLERGLDVNVKFTDVTKFEYTEEFEVFDAFRVSMYHGWVVDPQSEEYEALKSLSYNELTVRVAEFRGHSSDLDEPQTRRGVLLDSFLQDTASQLTFFGLMRLYEEVKENELAVLFRNDHFSTLHRHEGRLYCLVTDQGYADQSNVVWELLDNIDGNTELVDSSFVFLPVGSSTAQDNFHATVTGSGELQDSDYLLALQMSMEQSRSPPQELVSPPSPVRSTDNFNFTSTTIKRASQQYRSDFVAGRVQPKRPSQVADESIVYRAPPKQQSKSSCSVS